VQCHKRAIRFSVQPIFVPSGLNVLPIAGSSTMVAPGVPAVSTDVIRWRLSPRWFSIRANCVTEAKLAVRINGG